MPDSSLFPFIDIAVYVIAIMALCAAPLVFSVPLLRRLPGRPAGKDDPTDP